MFVKTLKMDERGRYYYELRWSEKGENGFFPFELFEVGSVNMDAGELQTTHTETLKEAEEAFQRIEKRVEKLRTAWL